VLIVDDVLLSPFKGIMWVFAKIDRAARDELESRGERLKKELSDLYMELDTGRISEQEFDARERQILDQLDRLKKAKAEQAIGQPSETNAPQSSAPPPPPSAPGPARAAPPAPADEHAARPAPAPTPPAPDPAHATPPAPEPPVPIYKRWWFWGAAGAVVTGVVGAAAAWFRGDRKVPETATPTTGPGGPPEATPTTDPGGAPEAVR
jgi:hypothetical protein